MKRHWSAMAVRCALGLGLLCIAPAASAQTATFTGGGPIALQSTPTADPYPQTLDASGLGGHITSVKVTLKGVTASSTGGSADTLAYELAAPSPDDTAVMLSRDVPTNVTGVDWTFADGAQPQPPNAPTGTYKPTDMATVSALPLTPQAPQTYGSAMSDFAGHAPNGLWRLYVQNDPSDLPTTLHITSWALEITTDAQPALAISPASLDFGSQTVGQSAAAQTVTLTNSGNAPLKLGTLSLTGANPNDFSMSPDQSCGTDLAANASCKVAISFAPVDSGPKSAALSIPDNAAGSPHSVPLSGVGATPITTPLLGPPLFQESGSPEITVKSAGFDNPPTVGRRTYLNVTASDAKQQVTGLLVNFGEKLGAYGESACVKGKNKPGTETFHVPYTFLSPGDHTIKITIFAGGCGAPVAHTYVFTVHVAPATATAARRVAQAAGGRMAHAALAEVTLTGPPITSKCKNKTLAPSARKSKLIIKALLCVMNEQRKLNHLRPLKLSARLAKAAIGHTRAMITGKFFAHQGPREAALVTRLKRVKYRSAAGENLGAGGGTLGTPLAMVDAWMHSSLHRANLLTKKYKYVGVGFMPRFPVPTTGAPLATYTTDFGTKR